MKKKHRNLFLISVTAIFIIIRGIWYYNSNCVDPIPEIINMEINGIVDSIYSPGHSLDFIDLKDKKSIEIFKLNVVFQKNVKIGDSVFTRSGDSTIFIYRKDSVFKYDKIGERTKDLNKKFL